MTDNGKYTVLVVDDEEDIVELLKYNLKKEGYKVKTASNGVEAMEIAKEFLPDLILLDIMMPKQDGIETCRQIRENAKLKDTHVTFLTARAEEYAEVAAFDAGADDYITKPIKPRALMSKVKAIFRRDPKVEKAGIIETGNLKIDRISYTASVDGKEVILPKKEFELLYYLAKKPNKVFSRDELLRDIWGTDVYVLSRTVDVHIRKIREKIGDDCIKTVKGVGYRFQ